MQIVGGALENGILLLDRDKSWSSDEPSSDEAGGVSKDTLHVHVRILFYPRRNSGHLQVASNWLFRSTGGSQQTTMKPLSNMLYLVISKCSTRIQFSVLQEGLKVMQLIHHCYRCQVPVNLKEGKNLCSTRE